MTRSNLISKSVLLQLETALYKEFIESIPVFELLPIGTIRLLKSNMVMKYERNVIRREYKISNIIFVTKGSFKI